MEGSCQGEAQVLHMAIGKKLMVDKPEAQNWSCNPTCTLCNQESVAEPGFKLGVPNI
jgi:hypothetical protein